MSIDTYPPQSTQATVLRTETVAPFGWNASLAVPANATWNDGIVTTNFFWWKVPEAYAGGDVTFTLYRRTGSASGTAVMTYTCTRIRVGTTLTTLEAAADINFSPGNVLTTVLTKTVPSSNIMAGDHLRFEVVRDGSHASDTMTVGVGMDGASVTYAAYVMGYAAYPAQVNNASYEEGTFTVTATGFTTVVTGTAIYRRIGKNVTILFPLLQATSNSTALDISGLPVALAPAITAFHAARVQNNSVDVIGYIFSGSNAALAVGLVSGGFTASGLKALHPCSITYALP